MFEQLRHLRKLNKRQHISIQIVPFTAGVKAAMNGSFAILDFAGATANGTGHVEVDYVVNVEELRANMEPLIHDNPETTSGYVEAFYGIRDIALCKEQTNDMLEAKIDSFRP
jgi:hypothetical protein